MKAQPPQCSAMEAFLPEVCRPWKPGNGHQLAHPPLEVRISSRMKSLVESGGHTQPTVLLLDQGNLPVRTRSRPQVLDWSCDDVAIALVLGSLAIAITRNSGKSRNSFLGEFRVPSYRFWPYT